MKKAPDQNQTALFDLGVPQLRDRWVLAVRFGDESIEVNKYRTLDACYEVLANIRAKGEHDGIRGSEILGPRAGKYRIIDGEVWDRKAKP